VSEDDGSEDESNNPTQPDKDDSSDIAVEDDDPFSKFEKEVIYEYMIMKYIITFLVSHFTEWFALFRWKRHSNELWVVVLIEII
jgi:hypothetical protein